LFFRPTCGWCSVNVYYGENQGKQCAGWNIDKTKDPFICPGTYSTVDCTPPPPPPTPPPAPTYLCNGTSRTCFEVKSNIHFHLSFLISHQTTPGHGTSKFVCEQTCGVHPIPSNSTPGELRGVWRGIQIHKNYTKGEWTLRVPESDSNVVLFVRKKKCTSFFVNSFFRSIPGITNGLEIFTQLQVEVSYG